METTKPKPFVFVLMPLAPEFRDIYMFGIKDAAKEAGAHAERVDEQVFVEGMLDRIFNQINKADVVVADMTGKNPNVFYEVGYAHALDKIVLLITQSVDDIPFDLKHRQHIVYGRSIESLKTELAPKIRWAITEAALRAEGLSPESISVRVSGRDLPRQGSLEGAPEIVGMVKGSDFSLELIVRNESDSPVDSISHVYLFCAAGAPAVPTEAREVTNWAFNSGTVGFSQYSPLSSTTKSQPFEIESFIAAPIDAGDGLVKQYRLPLRFGAIPPGATESGQIMFVLKGTSATGAYRLRVHGADSYHDFCFKLNIQKVAPPPVKNG